MASVPRQSQVGRPERPATVGCRAQRRGEHRLARTTQAERRAVDGMLERQRPAGDVHVVARPSQHAIALHRRRRRRRPGQRLHVCLLHRREPVVGVQQREAKRGDRVAHRHAAAVAAVELKAPHQTRIRQALQTALRRRGRPLRVEATVDLAAEHMSHTGDEREDLEVERFGFQRPWLEHGLGPAHAVCAVEVDELAVAVRWGARCRRRRRGSILRAGRGHALLTSPALDLGALAGGPGRGSPGPCLTSRGPTARW